MEKVLENWTANSDGLLSETIDFTSEEITELLINMGLIGVKENCRIEDLERYIFLYGNDQEIYCSEERSFIEDVGSVFIYNDINRRTNKGMITTKIIASDLCGSNETVKSCFFLMKVINKATDSFNIFLFKTDEGFFVGCRLYDKDIDKNCLLSNTIRTDEELDEIIQRLICLPTSDEFIPYYSAFVEAIEYRKWVLEDYDTKIIIRQGVDFSYLNMLSEIEKEYHINLDRAKEMHYESIEGNTNSETSEDYSLIMNSLRFIKSEKTNTLEMLFEAEEMALLAMETEQKNEKTLLMPNEEDSRDNSNDDILKKHINDPELMIKMLKAQKGR